MTTPRNHRAGSVMPESAPAGMFVGGLAAQDFAQLGGALAANACLRARPAAASSSSGLAALPVVLRPSR
jgi:hypothetical protein